MTSEALTDRGVVIYTMVPKCYYVHMKIFKKALQTPNITF